MPVKLAGKGQKKDLQAIKETLLKEISYLDRRIEQARNNVDKSTSLETEYSSDSEVELSLQDCGPSVVQLKQEKSMLLTRLQATNELRGLDLLQHEVNVLVAEPASVEASAVKEPGVWREVTAECSIDLVPFSITFLTHQPNRKFSPASYHALKVLPLKNAHEAELSASVLPGLKTPSDAVEVLMSYAAAYRSRRSTLARLADRFGKVLHMEPIPQGGYLLKCTDLLEMSWTLQNKWSPIAPFHHKMKFDLEYMDEQHIKIITQAHRQLIEPAVDTDERTLLLAKIIETCLKAKHGSEGVNYDQVLECEVMAPPKSLPKKVKSKKNQNASANTNTSESTQQKAVKRSVVEENDSNNTKQQKAVKRSIVDENDSSSTKQQKAVKRSVVEENDSNNTKQQKAVKRSVADENDSNNTKQQKAVKRSVAEENDNKEGAKKIKTKDSTNAVKESIANKNQGKTTEQVRSSVNDKPEKSVATDKLKKTIATSKNNVKSASDKPNVNGDAKTKTDETGKSNAKQNSGKTTEQIANKIAVENAGAKNKTVKSTNSKSNVDSSEKGKNDEVVTSGKDVNGENDPKPNKVKSLEKVKQVKNGNEPQTSKVNANNDNRRGTFVVASSVASVNEKPSVNNEKKQAENKNGNAQQNVGNKVNSANKVNKNAKNDNNLNLNIKKVINNKNSENKTVQKPNEAKKVVKAVNAPENGGSGKKIENKAVNNKKFNKTNLAKNVAVNKDVESRIPKSTATKSASSDKNQNGDNLSKNSDRNTSGIPKPLKPNVNKVSKSELGAAKTTKVTNNLKRVNSGNIEKENIQKQKITKVPQIKTSTPKMVKKVPLRISPRKPMSKKPLVGSNIKSLSKPASATNIPIQTPLVYDKPFRSYGY